MKFVSLLMSSLLLAACGGGGGGGAPAPAGPVASTSTFQLKQAYINDYTVVGAMPFKVSGFVNVNPNTPSAQTVTITGNGTETRGSQVSTTFAGQAALQKTTSVTGSITGTSSTGAVATLPLTTNSSTFVKADGSYEPLGSSSATSYSESSGPFTLPATAKVGDSGVFTTFLSYTTSAKAVATGSTTFAWALEADTASTAILKVTQTSKDLAGKVTLVAKLVARITPAGAVTQLTSNGESYDAAGNLTSNQTITY